MNESINQELLKEFENVMTWIKNWGPEFTYDPDWKVDEVRAYTAISNAKENKNGSI